MSVKELKFEGNDYGMYVTKENDYVIVQIDYKAISLNRNQAHLLKLWLEEHLK